MLANTSDALCAVTVSVNARRLTERVDAPPGAAALRAAPNGAELIQSRPGCALRGCFTRSRERRDFGALFLDFVASFSDI